MLGRAKEVVEQFKSDVVSLPSSVVMNRFAVGIIGSSNTITRKRDSAFRAIFAVATIMAQKQFEYSALKSQESDKRHLPTYLDFWRAHSGIE